MALRFVHTADLHLDSPLRSLALRDPELADLVALASRTALERVVALCLAEGVHALVIAGDLYDGAQTSMKTALHLTAQLGRLHAAGIATLIVRGNHDAESRVTRELVLPESVTAFDARGGVREIEGGGVRAAFHGASFGRPVAPESLLPRYGAPVDGAANVGIMHTSLDGAPGHDVYAPCRLADLDAHGFAYWALGHVHARSVAVGRATVVMPGMPQGRDMGETGPKSATLVTLGAGGTVAQEARPTALAEFARVGCDLAGAEDMRAVAARIEAALGRARDAAVADHAIVRLRLTGATPLAWALRRDPEGLRAQAEALRPPRLWIEAVDGDLAPPAAAGADGFGALAAIVARQLDDGTWGAEARAAAEMLRAALPRECRDALGADEAGMAEAVARLSREGADAALARLLAPEPD